MSGTCSFEHCQRIACCPRIHVAGAYWIAAAWDYDLVYVADYAEDIVYEMEIAEW